MDYSPHLSTLAFANPFPTPTRFEYSKRLFFNNSIGTIKPQGQPVCASPNLFASPRASLVTDLLVKSVEAATAAAVTRQLVPPSVNSAPGNVDQQILSKDGPSAVNSSTHVRAETITSNSIPVTNEMLRAANSFVDSLQTSDGRRKWTKLAVCIVIDLIGSGGLGIPLVSDILDVITAPLAALALHALFGNPAVTLAGFVEEILPGTDGIPTATIAWLAERNGYFPSSPLDGSMSDDD